MESGKNDSPVFDTSHSPGDDLPVRSAWACRAPGSREPDTLGPGGMGHTAVRGCPSGARSRALSPLRWAACRGHHSQHALRRETARVSFVRLGCSRRLQRPPALRSLARAALARRPPRGGRARLRLVAPTARGPLRPTPARPAAPCRAASESARHRSLVPPGRMGRAAKTTATATTGPRLRRGRVRGGKQKMAVRSLATGIACGNAKPIGPLRRQKLRTPATRGPAPLVPLLRPPVAAPQPVAGAKPLPQLLRAGPSR